MKYLLFVPLVLLAGCGDRIEHYTLPDEVSDFTTLYNNNCSGCHGPNGRNGAARPLNDPLVLAVLGKENVKEAITNGVEGTAMPAFSKSAGGELTDAQIEIIAREIDARWSRPDDFAAASLPPYASESGDAKAGGAAFSAYCSRCHGDGRQIVDPSYLSLLDDQSLRLTVIAGRSDRGSPDWRHVAPGHILTPDEISDVVAWMSGHRNAPLYLTQKRVSHE